MTEPMTMIQELKTRILNGGMISREEALALYEAPLEELCSAARRSSSISARTASTSVPSSTGRAAAARKIAGSAPNPPILLPAQRNILCWMLIPLSRKLEGITDRVFPAFLS